ncbi:VOC family protein [Candidatus Enterococcus ikei]|uniref:VOC family protein n=1 Tax=Candidatus Enterococcus ikei TaxID=2815326 RepID=A0ABS3H1R5_9ENTE|nr:VOC family protein [Enterococcus sp. DIV0869a]MBO0441461.1 VOC family protein [Enterococcus sp. DIV0869a]
MKQPITFISVTEHAKKQMDFYVDVFPHTTIQSVTYYDEYPERVLNGQLNLNGTLLYFLEMGPENPVTSGWNLSLFVEMDTEEEFDLIFSALSVEGIVIMGPEAAGIFQKVTWLTDKFGITWQLVFAGK